MNVPIEQGSEILKIMFLYVDTTVNERTYVLSPKHFFYRRNRSTLYKMDISIRLTLYVVLTESVLERVGARSEFFWGGWQAVPLGGGMTVMEKREILLGWVTKVCLKCTKKLG